MGYGYLGGLSPPARGNRSRGKAPRGYSQTDTLALLPLVKTQVVPREEGAPRWREVNSAALAGLGAQRDRPARKDQGVLCWRA